MVLTVGITGGIGSGKSTVAKIFEVLGIPVYYADDAAKELMNTDEELKKKIEEHFGKETYPGGKLDRKYLGSQVFNDSFKLDLLNSLVHPVTINHAAKWMQQQTTPYSIKEAALFFESGSADKIDYMIGVYAPQHIRIKRVMDRDGVTREEVLKRIDRQINEELKMKLCDFIIINNEQQLVIPQVMELHEKLLALSKK
ncbi:MAG: dephospho-CoA kinase [Chitinophagaceae bacterium]|nr:dephospho-CoA kinase [Chitinophagaceae bacterium]